MEIITGKPLSRRTVLRGLGAALALPFLDAMTPTRFSLHAQAATANRVHRFQTFYVPNGMAMPFWTPEAEGRDFELTPILEPLAPYRDQLLVLSGIYANWVQIHAGASGSFLTGVARGGRNEVEIVARDDPFRPNDLATFTVSATVEELGFSTDDAVYLLGAHVRVVGHETVGRGRILAVATHTHFDHIGSHHEFAERAVHPAEAALLAKPDRKATLADPFATLEMFEALPPGGWDEAAYAVTPAPATRLLEDGEVVDLGDRHFEVLHLPGHSPGSIALWEAASGILFSGDTLYDGPLVDDCAGADTAAYRRSMERLLELPVRVVHGGHFPSFGRDRLRALIRAWLEGQPVRPSA